MPSYSWQHILGGTEFKLFWNFKEDSTIYRYFLIREILESPSFLNMIEIVFASSVKNYFAGANICTKILKNLLNIYCSWKEWNSCMQSLVAERLSSCNKFALFFITALSKLGRQCNRYFGTFHIFGESAKLIKAPDYGENEITFKTAQRRVILLQQLSLDLSAGFGR